MIATSGFEGVYTNKAGKTAEGSATFWRRSRFAAVARRDLNFREIFGRLADSQNGEVRANNPSSVFCAGMNKRASCCQLGEAMCWD